MAVMSIYGTNKPVRMWGERKPCTRCGVVRETKPGRDLCRDCRSGMTAYELRLWAA